MDVRVVLEDLVLDGVEPGHPLVAQALERAIADALPAEAPASPHMLAAEVAAAVQTEAAG